MHVASSLKMTSTGLATGEYQFLVSPLPRFLLKSARSLSQTLWKVWFQLIWSSSPPEQPMECPSSHNSRGQESSTTRQRSDTSVYQCEVTHLFISVKRHGLYWKKGLQGNSNMLFITTQWWVLISILTTTMIWFFVSIKWKSCVPAVLEISPPWNHRCLWCCLVSCSVLWWSQWLCRCQDQLGCSVKGKHSVFFVSRDIKKKNRLINSLYHHEHHSQYLNDQYIYFFQYLNDRYIYFCSCLWL